MMYNILTWAVFGLIAGAIARFVLPGKQSMSIVMTIVLGVVGSFVGGALSRVVFGGGNGLFNRPAGSCRSSGR
jgi:uncharacterized membrane protein YeaQ/YmgE (transglycosylase-associated protein family)